MSKSTSSSEVQAKAVILDSLFREYNEPHSAGASVMVIKEGNVLWTKAYGLADVEAKIPATTNTNYRLASVTKQFTAMGIMILAERKKLSYDSRLTDFFPNFPAYGKQITVRHLLQHTSGLMDYEDLIPTGTTNQLKDRDVLALLKEQGNPLFSPGEQFRYSNSGYALLALILEKASGLSFAEFLKRNIFDPLGMMNTVAHEEGVTTVRERAYGYAKRTNGFERTDQSLTSAVLGDGGIYSSLVDLYKWDQALYTDRLVSRETLQQAFTPTKLNDGHEQNYGFGWQLNTYRGLKVTSHSGTTIGFRNFIARFPDQKFTVIVLTNRSSPIAPEILDRILDLFLLKSEASAKRLRVCQQIVGHYPLDGHARSDL